MEYTISRKKLIDITDSILTDFLEKGLTKKEKKALLRTAKLMKKIQTGTWYGTDCGCLIGSHHMELKNKFGRKSSLSDPALENFSNVEYNIGIEFDRAIKRVLKIEKPYSIVKVVN